MIGIAAMLLPTAPIDLYLDYNIEAAINGMSARDKLARILNTYALNQDITTDLVGDWKANDSIFATTTSSGVNFDAQFHHIIPLFLSGSNNISNLLDLPCDEHARFHRLLEAEFRSRGLDSPNVGGDRRWLTRLQANEVTTKEKNLIRSAMMDAGRKFDTETGGKYNLAGRIRAGLNRGSFHVYLHVGRWVRRLRPR
jgi:hypothetical protein